MGEGMSKGADPAGVPSVEALFEGVRAGDRTLLARAITLVESRAPRHQAAARDLIARILPLSGGALRVGLTGVPGAGKSTFIEALGMFLCQKGSKVAVLAVDPSSSRSGGSILGDKTRMESLSREPQAFIRPSPSGGNSGGVAARTREAMLLCEAAGYEVILVETMGVGQGETEVRTMTDFFLLLQITGGGDELQGIKKGVIEMADAIVVNKADGDNRERAHRACREFQRILHVLQPFSPGWEPVALTCSALDGNGIEEVWEVVERFRESLRASGNWTKRRQAQNVDWFRARLRDALMEQFFESRGEEVREMEVAVAQERLPVAVAIERLCGSGEATPRRE